jgi:uncharacterized RDD family membrane protein YckC
MHMNNDTLNYAGFWPRLASALLDLIILVPLMALMFWGSSTFRLFDFYYFLPGTAFGLFYSVYLVGRFGGTPGKLIVGIRIRKLNGEPIGYRQAFLRYSVGFILGMATSLALLFPLFHLTDAEYHSLSFMERSQRLIELAPFWYKPSQWVQTAWGWSELIVLLTNRKRRALHDFIAGTVVVHVSPAPDTELKPTVPAPVV